jgi:hypothetical protein
LKIQPLDKGLVSHCDQRITELDIPLSNDKLSQIVGKVFKTIDKSSISQEFALVQENNENYYSLTELRLIFVDDQTTGT